ncbi:MAG: hypothetical protein ABSF18_05935 [Gammaproteobacteria bacterium]
MALPQCVEKISELSTQGMRTAAKLAKVPTLNGPTESEKLENKLVELRQEIENLTVKLRELIGSYISSKSAAGTTSVLSEQRRRDSDTASSASSSSASFNSSSSDDGLSTPSHSPPLSLVDKKRTSNVFSTFK